METPISMSLLFMFSVSTIYIVAVGIFDMKLSTVIVVVLLDFRVMIKMRIPFITF